MDYESSMRENVLCVNQCTRPRISNVEIPGLPVGLFDSVEQTALTRAKATLLMKATLERVANEQDARKKAERLAGEKKTKLLNDMSVMKPSESWKMAVDDRVRGLLKSESSQKGKGKGKGKGKNKTCDPQKLYSLYQDHNGPLSEDQVEQVMLQKKMSNLQRELGQSQARRPHQAQDPSRGVERAPATERSRAKRRARPNHKRRKARAKERALEWAST